MENKKYSVKQNYEKTNRREIKCLMNLIYLMMKL